VVNVELADARDVVQPALDDVRANLSRINNEWAKESGTAEPALGMCGVLRPILSLEKLHT